jgi:hypothetical protein
LFKPKFGVLLTIRMSINLFTEEGYTMSLIAYDISAGLFIRGLTNLKMQLTKAQKHAVASGKGEATLLEAQLATFECMPSVSYAPTDLHMYTLAAHVHWAAEGAKLATSNLLGVRLTPTTNNAKSFANLHQHLNTTIAYLQDIAPSDLESGLDRTIAIQHPRGSTSSSGHQFLTAFAIPHFFYHITTAYGILRNEGLQLTMGDFLGNWGES